MPALSQLRVDALVRAGEHHAHLAAVQIDDDLLQRLQAGDVHERHPAQRMISTFGSVWVLASARSKFSTAPKKNGPSTA